MLVSKALARNGGRLAQFANHAERTSPTGRQTPPSMKKSPLVVSFALALAWAPLGNAATASLAAGTYTENFNALSTSLPAGWDVRTGATGTGLGSTVTFSTSTRTWGDTAGAFKNLSAADIASDSSTADQSANTNRSLGIRQTSSFGDPGASFNFNFSTAGLDVTSISIDLSMLNVQPRSTSWSIQYGVGADPSSFTTLGTWEDPGVFGTSSFVFDVDDFGTALNEKAQLWFRVVALSGSTESGARDTMGIDNFSITTAVVIPEPSIALLSGLGLLGLLRRRR
jgi:hypothetical protein